MVDNVGGSKLNNVLKAKEDLLKTPEELESEKQHAIKSRLPKLDLQGLSEADLKAQVKCSQKNLIYLIYFFKS